MNKLQPNNFPEFFKAIYAFDPFPWQRMLVERIAEKGWPEGIDLPTASGKTACLDAAVFLMALEENEGRLLEGSSARRRVFFVVDRRIVVDEAYNRAKKLANELEKATTGIVKQVADRLRDLAGGNTPLIASRLRGGTVRDDRWRLSPAQPAIVTGTVDQIGSRMLFRSYGAGLQSAPIEAALTACDSLLLLDEAHCAVPFMQTGRAVQRYAGGSWIDGKPFVSALTFSILSATLPADVTDIFPIPEEREKALRHDLLDKRINASKPAELVETKDVKGRDEKFIAEVLRQAHQAVKGGRRRIAIMVNRVARASEIAGQLRAIAIGGNSKLDADVVLMTGRMRPIDRDTLVDRWSPLLKSGSKLMPDRPIVLVTTQCLEVGADFSFDALITECASLDALRQRFGRLNRLGDLETTYAAVLVRKPDLGAKAEDPIYGTALKETWNWLNDNAVAVEKSKTFDFGIAKVDEALASCDAERSELLSRLNAPSPDAPVLLPAHVDLLCQTAPKPTPDPDVAIYLHGPQRYAPEVRVVFRADLINSDRADWREAWCDTVSLLPPLTGESLSVPLWLIRKWLAGELQPQDTDELGDVEGQSHKEESGDHLAKQPFLIWRSRKEGVVSHQPNAIRPNDSVIVPADSAFAAQLESAHAFCRLPDMPLDIAEQASWQGKGRPILRLLDSTLEQAGLTEVQPVKQLVTCLRDEDRGADELIEQLSHLAKYSPENESEVVLLAQWLKLPSKPSA